ncbi:MAG: phosphotransferase [Polyangia bacterium]
MSDVTSAARAALSEYVAVEGVPLAPQLASPQLVRPLGDGLINETFLVELAAPARRCGRCFSVSIRCSGSPSTTTSKRSATHLAHKGLPTPRLLRTRQGALAVDRATVSGGCFPTWRDIPFADDLAAMPAGELVARFHSAVADLDHRFHFVRSGRTTLPSTCETCARPVDTLRKRTPHLPRSFTLAVRMLRWRTRFLQMCQEPLRICHGDLKINNLRFSDEGRGICLLDLDSAGQSAAGT